MARPPYKSGQAFARFHHGPDVFFLVGNEVDKDQAILVFAEGFAQRRFHVCGFVDAHADVAVAFHEIDKVGQAIDIRFGITRAVIDLLPLAHHAQIAVV